MYESLINRKHRGLFVIAIDCSVSMQERITFNSLSLSKAEAVALVCNYTIDELIARATRQGIVRDYYDIAVIGYSGDSIQPLIGDGTQQRIAIDLLAKMAPEPCSYTFDQHPDDGTTVGATFTLRPWITPRAAANTPMHKAMIEIERIVAEWCRMPENRDSFPPVVINISDGECSDGTATDLIGIAERIKSHATHDGNTLLLNIHLTTNDEAESVAFPANGLFDDICPFRRMLFAMSSILPETMEPLIEELINPGSYGPYRCVAFNASINELIMILAIGSESLKNM